MPLLIIIMPFIGASFAGFFSRWFGFYGACVLSIFGVFSACVFSWIMFFKILLLNTSYHLSIGLWMDSEWFMVFWGFVFDSLSVTMLIVVTTISLLVHIYSTNYMENDPHLARFMTYLSVFTLFMLILVTADNMVQLFLGWEGVGLSSYLLINFWFTRLQANKAAMKAMIVNKLGDVGVILGLIFFFV